MMRGFRLAASAPNGSGAQRRGEGKLKRIDRAEEARPHSLRAPYAVES